MDRVTIPEFIALSKAQAKKNVDREYCLHKVAWLTAVARATKKNGKMHYAKFDKFFCREKAMEQIDGKPEMSERAKRIIEYRKKRKGGKT